MQNRRKAANKRARLPWKALMCKAKTFTLLEQLKQSEKVIVLVPLILFHPKLMHLPSDE